MSNRDIALQLFLLLILFFLGTAYYAYQKSPAVVPDMIRYVESGNVSARRAAIQRLQELGPAARAAVPSMLALATNPQSEWAAGTAEALVWIDLTAGRKVMEMAINALRDPDANTRRRAAETLGSLGALGKPAVAPLADAAHDADAVVRDRVIRALARIGIPPDQVVAVLIGALDDPAYHVQHAAVAALNFDITPAIAQPALPALRRLAGDQKSSVSQLAQSAINRIEHTNPATDLAVSRYSMTRDDAQTLAYTLRRLAMLGPQAAPLAPDISKHLQADSDFIRYLACETLGAIGPAAHGNEAAIQILLNDREPVIRECAQTTRQAVNRD